MRLFSHVYRTHLTLGVVVVGGGVGRAHALSKRGRSSRLSRTGEGASPNMKVRPRGVLPRRP